jgi:hypothetical protein
LQSRVPELGCDTLFSIRGPPRRSTRLCRAADTLLARPSAGLLYPATVGDCWRRHTGRRLRTIRSGQKPRGPPEQQDCFDDDDLEVEVVCIMARSEERFAWKSKGFVQTSDTYQSWEETQSERLHERIVGSNLPRPSRRPVLLSPHYPRSKRLCAGTFVLFWGGPTAAL